jgi:hypothetical protein
MQPQWSKRRVLIVVKTYPVPVQTGIEVSCTAAVTADGSWLRLFPVPYRFLEEDRRFRKYQWTDVDVIRAKSDVRPESYKLNPDTIEVRESVPASDGWRQRRHLLRPLMRSSMCAIRREREAHGAPTLGLFKPAEIRRLRIDPTAPSWTPQELACLRQMDMFRGSPATEKVPFKFRYEFRCSEATCLGHTMLCTDWEMGQAYRRWRREYGTGWEAAFRHRFEGEMIRKYDTHFYVGTIHQHPNTWIIVGLFYPPPEANPELPF